MCIFINAAAIVVSLSEFPSLPYENNEHPLRNLAVFSILIILSALSAYVPEFVLPICACSFIYMILTSINTAAVSLIVFLMVSMCVSGEGSFYVLYYMICSLALFFQLPDDKAYKRSNPAVVSFVLIRSVLFVIVCFILNVEFTPELILTAAGGLVLDTVILILGLYRLKQDVIFKLDNEMTLISDPEHPLLKALREESRFEFFRAVHTAYLCSKCARIIGLNEHLLKALGYYHRIGYLRGDNQNLPQKTVSIAMDNGFSPKLIDCLRQYGLMTRDTIGREAAVTILCDRLVHSIMEEFKKSDKVDYIRHIEAAIDSIFEDPALQVTLLSLKEINELETTLKGEKLYYDFLR